MVRHVKDPWGKKSRKGMKKLGLISNLAIGVVGLAATAAASEYKNANNKTSDNNLISLTGCLVMIVGVIISVVVGIFEGINAFFGMFVAFVIIGLFVSALTNDSKKSKSSEIITKQSQADAQNDDNKSLVQPPVLKGTVLVYSQEKFNLIKNHIFNMKPIEQIESELSSLPYASSKDLLIKALNDYYSEMATGFSIPAGSESYIDSIIEKFSLPSSEIQTLNNKCYVEYIKVLNLQDILNGIVPKRVSIDHPLNLAKGEQPLWGFPSVDYFEETTYRSNFGSARGVSVKIAKGIYYRVGAFKGYPIITSGLKQVAHGDMIITNKCIYLYSRQKSIKYAYNKILAYVPYEDGIGVQLDKTNSKTVYFRGLDGRYAYNIVINVNNLA